jgi:hypothetical protein
LRTASRPCSTGSSPGSQRERAERRSARIEPVDRDDLLAAADGAHWSAIIDGQRIGFAFPCAIIAELQARGCYKIDLNVRHDNPIALAFWRSVGFDLASYRMRMYPPE